MTAGSITETEGRFINMYKYNRKRYNTYLCQQCTITDCLYREESVMPVIKIIRSYHWDTEDPYIRQLDAALQNFTCEYFRKEVEDENT